MTKVDTNIENRAATAYAVQETMARMWLEAEKPSGARADLHFIEEGTFVIDGMVDAQGRDAIRKVGSFREEIGPRHSRHLMSNYVVDADEPGEGGLVIARAVMTHFGGTGHPPLPLEGVLGVYDVTLDLIRQPGGGLLLRRLHMRPIFVAANHPTRSMPKSFSHPNAA